MRDAFDAAFKFVQNMGRLYLSCLRLRSTFGVYSIVTWFGDARRPRRQNISTCIPRACFITETVPAQQQWRPNRAGRTQHIHRNTSNLFGHAAAFWRQHAKHSPDMLHPSVHTKAHGTHTPTPMHAPQYERTHPRMHTAGLQKHNRSKWCPRREGR